MRNKIKLQKDHGTNRNATGDKLTSPQQQKYGYDIVFVHKFTMR